MGSATFGRVFLSTLVVTSVATAIGRTWTDRGNLGVNVFDAADSSQIENGAMYLEGDDFGALALSSHPFGHSRLGQRIDFSAPAGRYRLGVTAPGYEPMECGVQVVAETTRERTVYLQRAEWTQVEHRELYGYMGFTRLQEQSPPDTTRYLFECVRVSGRVSDAKTGRAIQGACVFIEGTRTGATTGADGRFRFNARAGRYRIMCAWYWRFRQAGRSIVFGMSPQETLEFRLEPFKVDMANENARRMWLGPGASRRTDSLGLIAGQVYDRSTGQEVDECGVYADEPDKCTHSSSYGHYHFNPKPGSCLVSAIASWFQPESVRLSADTAGKVHTFSLVPLWDPDSMPERLRRVERLTGSVPLFPAQDSNRWGYIDPDGRIVIEPQFLAAEPFNQGRAWVQDAGRHQHLWGVIDRTGRYVAKPVFESPGVFSEGLSPARVRPAFGFIDRAGREVVPCQFNSAWDFSEGLARVRVDSLYGWIDREGNWAIRPRYRFAEDFHDGRARVRGTDSRGGLWGYIDQRGRNVIPPAFRAASDFSHGRAAVHIGKGWAYIDRDGRRLPIHTLYKAQDFSEGVAAAALDITLAYRYGLPIPDTIEHGNRYGFIDTSGHFVVVPQFEDAGRFHDGCAAVRMPKTAGHKWGFIDRNGRFVVEPEYDQVKEFSDGLAAVFKKGGEWRYVDTAGRTAYIPEEGYLGTYASGMVRFRRGPNMGFRDRTGKTVIVPQFYGAYDFVGNYAPIEKDRERAGWVTLKGRVIMGSDFSRTLAFSEGLAPVVRGRNWGFADTTARVVVPCRYMWVGGFKEGRAMVRRAPKWGYIDPKGRMVIPPIYESVGPFSEGLARVTDTLARFLRYGSYDWDPVWGYIDKKGNVVVEPQFATATEFSAGLAAVGKWHEGELRYGYIDRSGGYAIPDTFYLARAFSEGMAAVAIWKRDSLRDTTAREPPVLVLEPRFRPRPEAPRWGWINRDGVFAIEPVWGWAGSFSEGVAAAAGPIPPHYGWGLVDSTGDIVVDDFDPGLGDHDFTWYHEGAMVLKWSPDYFMTGHEMPDPRACFVDRRGRLLTTRVFEDAGDFSHGIAPVKWQGSWHYIDKSGRFVW